MNGNTCSLGEENFRMKYYIFYTRNERPQLDTPSLVQVTHEANAAANLGYPTLLVYLKSRTQPFNGIEFLRPFNIQKINDQVIQAYNLGEKLKEITLPIPWSLTDPGGKWTDTNTIVSKYYFPFHLASKTQILHTRDWNLARVAIRCKVPVIYEQDHDDQKTFETEIVQSPYFQVAVTVAESLREKMIGKGMPPEKTVSLHNGFNKLFLIRRPQEAEDWRKQLIPVPGEHLVVYAGALYPFKGVDMLIDVAKMLPDIQFAIAGGKEEQVKSYQQQAQEKQVNNVKFLGFLSQEKLASLLQAADILAYPHRSGEASTFTSPLKFFDYMASGTPIVATEILPLKEFKSVNMAVGWCEPNNPDRFAEMIQHVLSKYPRKTDGYTNSIESVEQFSWENRVNKILNHVEESMRPTV